jgi:hypothetical protein
MLVVGTHRLDERDGREMTGLEVGEEVLLVPQMAAPWLAGAVGGVIVERLVVELEQEVRAIGEVALERVGVGACGTGAIGPARATDIVGGVVPPT